MAKEISQEYLAIVFYRISPATESMARFYHDVLQWLQELGCSPDRAGVTGPGHSGKVRTFKWTNAKLLSTGFEGVTSFSIISDTPDARISVNDYLLESSLSVRNTMSYACVAVRRSLVPLSRSDMLLSNVRRIIADVKPSYGIAYTREHRLGPLMYGIGVAQGLDVLGPEYDEALAISRWGCVGMEKQVYRQGVLRDIYPWNFLTAPQLKRPVGDLPIERWIHQDAHRGRLEPVVADVWLWEVADAAIPAIQQVLRESGTIFHWRDHALYR